MGIVKTKQENRRAMKAAIRRVATVLVLGTLIVSALYLYDYMTTSERFAIADVELRGVTRIDDADLRRLLADLEGQNLLLAPIDELENRLEMHPRVETATMRRVVPDRIVCDIVEREPVALIFTDRFLEVDRAGMIMEDDAFTALLDLPIITGVSGEDVRPGRVSEAASVQSALEVLRVARDLGGDFASVISELRVGRGGVVVRSLEDDRVIVLGDTDYETRLRKYFTLYGALDDEADSARRVVDLRFEDQVVLRGGI